MRQLCKCYAAAVTTPSNDMADRVCMVTGANTGIGRSTAMALAKRGAQVILACRSLEKARPVAEEIRQRSGNDKVSVHQLDLSRFSQVRQSAQQFLETGLPLHVLINNAGLAGTRGITPEGFELAFGTNHLGPFLFTLLLLDTLKASAPARIVNVASNSHRLVKTVDYTTISEPTRSITGLSEYGRSKLANILFASELAKRLEGTGVTTYSLNPGRIASDIWKRVPWPVRPLMKTFMKSNAEGAQTSVRCATSEDLASHSGRYYNQCIEKKPSTCAQSREAAIELWERSCDLVGIKDPLPLS